MDTCARVSRAAVLFFLTLTSVGTFAQSPAQNSPPPPTMGGRFEFGAGSRAIYKVQEQFVGIDFPSAASGSTSNVTGTLVIAKDGSIDANGSKLTVDLRTLQSDQDNRDNFLRTRVFETEKFPFAEFIPRRAVGLPHPLPSSGQTGFQLIGDMTVHGTTAEVTWTVVSTLTQNQIAGRATTTFNFATFGLTKPQIARLLSVEDKVDLEVEFRAKRTALP